VAGGGTERVTAILPPLLLPVPVLDAAAAMAVAGTGTSTAAAGVEEVEEAAIPPAAACRYSSATTAEAHTHATTRVSQCGCRVGVA